MPMPPHDPVVDDPGDPPPAAPVLIAEFSKVARISGPVCPNGGDVAVRVRFLRGHGTIIVRMQARCVNSCVTDNLEPMVGVTVFNTAGNQVLGIERALPMVPARGLAPPTTREVEADVELHNSFEIGRIEFEIKNLSHGSPFVDVLNFALPHFIKL
jgi:hypothetical protein